MVQKNADTETPLVFLDTAGRGFEERKQPGGESRYNPEEAEMVIMSAVGGETITTTVEGRERYSVNVRYARELRDDIEKLKRVLVPTMSGMQVPLAQLADIKLVLGPAMIRNENGLLSGYVYVDMADRDIGSYVRDAKKAVRQSVKLPAGYSITWSGQYEYMERVKQRLGILIPSTLLMARYESIVRKLQKFGFIEQGKLTEKGVFSSKIFAAAISLPMTIIFFMGFYCFAF